MSGLINLGPAQSTFVFSHWQKETAKRRKNSAGTRVCWHGENYGRIHCAFEHPERFHCRFQDSKRREAQGGSCGEGTWGKSRDNSAAWDGKREGLHLALLGTRWPSHPVSLTLFPASFLLSFFLPLSPLASRSFLAENFPEPGPGFEWGTVTKRCDVTFSSQNITFQIRCDAARFRIFFFKYFHNFPGTWYKCDDFVTSSHHFSGFCLEQTLVSKLGSGFQVFQFRLGTTLTVGHDGQIREWNQNSKTARAVWRCRHRLYLKTFVAPLLFQESLLFLSFLFPSLGRRFDSV